MEFRKCSRCGNFYVSSGNVCPKCSTKENLELSVFNSYIEQNGHDDSIDIISGKTGISTKNINRFLEYNNLKGQEHIKNNNNKVSNNGNDGITFFI